MQYSLQDLNGVTVYLSKTWTGPPLNFGNSQDINLVENPKKHYLHSLNALPATGSTVSFGIWLPLWRKKRK